MVVPLLGISCPLLRRLLRIGMAAAVLLGLAAAAAARAESVAEAGWREVMRLPFVPANAVAWRDTVFVGGVWAFDDSLRGLLAVPLRPSGGRLLPTLIAPPAGLKLSSAGIVGILDDALLVSAVSSTLPGARVRQRLLLYDGRWRPFPGDCPFPEDSRPCESPVDCAVGPVISGGALYAVRCFQEAGAGTAERLIAWDGARWHKLGSALDLPASEAGVGLANCSGRLLARSSWRRQEEVDLDGDGAALHRGWRHVGYHAIWEWDGRGWVELVRRRDAYLSHLVALNGTLYGAFSHRRPGSEVTAVMALGPTGWRSLGGEFGPDIQPKAGEPFGAPILALAVHRGHLVVAGVFDRAGGVACRGVAIWDGKAWRDMGSGQERGGPIGLLSVAGQLWRFPLLYERHDCDVPIDCWEGPLPVDGPGVPHLEPVAGPR